MKKLWDIICSYSIYIKILGRFIIFICFILLLVDVFGGAVTKNTMQSIPWTFIIIGVGIYAIGWIGNIFERRRAGTVDDSDDLSAP